MELTLTTTTTVRDLATQGFNREEIKRLQALKSRHVPFREYCESNRIYEQFCFLKWRYEQGEFAHA